MNYEGIKNSSVIVYLVLQLLKKAIYSDGESVEAVTCDTEILCLLLHYMNPQDHGKNSFVSNMKSSKSSEQHVFCRVQDFE